MLMQRTTSDNQDGINSAANAVGSLGMVLSSVRKPTGDQDTLSFSIKNDSEHVFVPYKVQCNAGFYTAANLGIIAPSQNSNLDFNINETFNDKVDLFLHFSMIDSNGKSADCVLHITETTEGEILPYSLNASPENVLFDRNEQDDSVANNALVYAAKVGGNDGPSFGISAMGVSRSSHSVGITITPWRQV